VVDGTPQIHPLASDPNHHLVEVPAIARPSATLAQGRAIAGPNFSTQRRTVSLGNVEPSRSQQLLDIAVAQREAEIEPDRVLDDIGREAVAAVAERSHGEILPDTPLAPDQFP
jgi:hypothetical protein